jgi:hypothetical protein
MLKTLSFIPAFGQNRDEHKTAPCTVATPAIIPKENKEIQSADTDSASFLGSP